MIPYLLHVSILIAGCYTFYWLLLRKETFFKINRGVLIACLLIPMVLPLITIPASWAWPVFQDQQLANQTTSPMVISIPENAPTNLPSTEVQGLDNSNQQASTQVPEMAKSETITPIPNQPSVFKIQHLFYLYLIGVAVFSIGFLIQLILILAKVGSLNTMQDGKYKIVELVKDEAPYSFWNTIFINPTKYDPETYEQILAHEKIHIDQTHYLDMLLVEIAVIAFWFNPFVWLFRKAITNNLEFLTDESMLTKGFPKQSYQLSLLKVSVPQYPLNLTTNYNQSFLKNRIAMMNTKKSSARSAWKYLFILPILGFSIISLNAVEKPDTPIEISETAEYRLGENTIKKTNVNTSETVLENKILTEATNTEGESEENQQLKEEVMAQLKRDNLLEEEAPVFKLFPDKILLNDKPLKSKLRKKYKAIFLKHGISADKSKLLVVKPLVIMSGSFVGNENTDGSTHIDVFDEEDNAKNKSEKVTLHTTTTTTTNSGDGSQISVTNIEGKTYLRGNGKHYINGKMYKIKTGEVTVIDKNGNSKVVSDPNSVENALLKAHDKARSKNKSKNKKINKHTTVTTSGPPDYGNSDKVEISISNGKTYIKSEDGFISIQGNEDGGQINIGGDDNEMISINGSENGVQISISDGTDQGSYRYETGSEFNGKYKHQFHETTGDGNFHFLDASDQWLTSTNRFWTLPDFCVALNNNLVEEKIIEDGDKVILYYLGSDGIFLNGQHLTGKTVRKFEKIAKQNKIPLSNDFHFEMDRNQVIILDQIADIDKFKHDLLAQLSADNLIDKKRKRMVMEISGNILSVNGQDIPKDKYSAYFQLFDKHRIIPSPGKTIETHRKNGKDHIQVGYSKDNAVLGTFASY